MMAKKATTSSMEPMTSASVTPRVWMAAGRGMASRLAMLGQTFIRKVMPAAPSTSPSAEALSASTMCALENRLAMPWMGLSLLNLGLMI